MNYYIFDIIHYHLVVLLKKNVIDLRAERSSADYGIIIVQL